MHHAGDFCRIYFSESPFNSLKDDTCKHSVRGGVLAWWLVKYVTYMPFYSVYEMRHKIYIRYFFFSLIKS